MNFHSALVLSRTGSFLLLASVFASLFTAHAGEVRTVITYVSREAVFIDAGRDHRLNVSDHGDVLRDEVKIATLEITFASDRSASCRVVESTKSILVGDSVIVAVADTNLSQQTIALEAPKSVDAPPVVKVQKHTRRTTYLTGRISLRTYAQDDRSTLNSDFQEPSLALNSRLSRIGGSGWNLALRLRLRKEMRTSAGSFATETQWDNRVYEVALTFGDDQTRFGMRAGRFVASNLSGIGYIDGALLSVKATRMTRIGVFGGTQPDLRTTDFQTEELRSGVFATYATPTTAQHKWDATLALAGRYRAGQISREFAYEQIQFAAGNKLRLYQNMEINLNRGWLQEAEGSALTLSSLMTGVTWTMSKWLSSELSYSNQRNYFTYETRHVADSLFDDAVRQGVRAALRTRAGAWFAGTGGNVRATGGNFSAGHSYSGNFGSTNLLGSQVHVELRWTSYDNEYSRGDQPTVTVRRPVLSTVSLGVESGADRYQFKSSPQSVRAKWSRASMDWTVFRHIFGSTYAELRDEDSHQTVRYFIESGYRF